MRKKYELTEAEWLILEIAWGQEHCTAPDVQELLEDRTGWAYSTVKTLMDRMVVNGLLETERIRKMILYRAGIKRVQAQRAELTRAAKRAFHGAFSPLVEFLLDDNKLSKEELEHLGKMIRQKRDRKGTSKPKK
ncbi:MAG: BlaI/MecI/CopY family transcriptional regulator [Phycisphaerae bacterium]|nr:BlaI/MecI/CopY family transcriptional regulator [Phycisphaerae bacterium]